MITELLKEFSPISLSEMDEVKLMDRTDTKFVFHLSRLPELLEKAKNVYRILEIDQERNFEYRTTYLDTKDFLFFKQHMDGRPQRYKVRYRLYEATGISFLEVKCKTSKNRTLKWRIQNQLSKEHPDLVATKFLCSHIRDAAFEVTPVLINSFNRITLVGLTHKERITLDFNVSFSGENATEVDLPFLAIAELKTEGSASKSPFLSILRQMQIRKTGFSKYCIGNALIRPMNKTNILKHNLLFLKKLQNEPYHYSIA